MKFNGGNPVWLDENDVIVRYATQLEIYERLSLEGRKYAYEHMNEEERKEVDDLFGNPTNQSIS
jgi:hypothetical protein